MPQLHVRAGNKLNMIYIIAIIGAFIFLSMSENKHTTPSYVNKKHVFTEDQIQHLQSIGFITDEEIEEYRKNKQII
jgi:hypothetical protein